MKLEEIIKLPVDKKEVAKRLKSRHKRAEYSKKAYQRIKNTKAYAAYRKEISNRYYRNNLIKAKARGLIGKAVLRGKIIKLNYCAACLKEKDILHGHHEDYSKPLEVIWLCPSCHRLIENFKKAVIIANDIKQWLRVKK